MGCRVVGIVGSAEKAALIKGKFGVDEAINYRITDLNKLVHMYA